MVGRVWPRHGGGGRPLNSVVRRHLKQHLSYDQARAEMAAWLERNAATPDHPESGYEEMDESLDRGGGPEWNKLLIALSFWDGWIDASNHQWRYYEPITEREWPLLAIEIAAALRADREIDNAVIRQTVDFSAKGGRK